MPETLAPEQILAALPYQRPFLFVDEIHEIDEQHILGSYTFREDEFFYPAHFPDQPLTPGVILIECMAQIGLVSLGMHLWQQEGHLSFEQPPAIAFTSTEAEFLRPVFPGDKVTVRAEKVYFRLGKLKVRARMDAPTGQAIARATLAGMMIPVHEK